MEGKKKIILEDIIGDYVVRNISAFNSYLKQIWKDLTNRSELVKDGIDRISFGKYFLLPGLISERLFSVFDINKRGYLSLEDFTSSMIILFSGDYEKLLIFIFNFYDFNKDKKITKEDIRIVLSYVPLYKKVHYNQGLKFEKDNFEDRLIMQKELHEKLDNIFNDKESINFFEFKYIIKNINSDIFLYILVFLMERRPFSNETIKNLDNIKKNVTERENCKYGNYIAIPNIDSKLSVSRTIYSKSPSFKLNNSENFDKLNHRIYKNNKVKNKILIKKEKEFLTIYNTNNNNQNDLDSFRTNGLIRKKPSRKTEKNISMIKDTYEKKENFENQENNDWELDYARPYDTNYNNENEDNTLNITNLTNISKINNDMLTDGYLLKIQGNKVKKIYFKLICKDLYYYKSHNNKKHSGIHNLSGVFIKDNGLVNIGNKKFFCFTIIFPTKQRKYYLNDEVEYHKWVNTIRKIVGYSNLNDLYEIKQVLGKGKFGLVKLGVHRINGRRVAIKIINKKLVTSIDRQQVKTEIDILKIAKHPNIIKLYDVFENENYIYIIMEYCAGGDLFTYLEKRGFRLPETRAAEIIHKLSTAVYFLHEYGIVHRDLKPENILMISNSNNADIRLVDFGLGKIIGPGEMCTEPFGTISYVAPEVLREKPYSFEVDLFSIGIIAYLLVAGFLPFDHETSEKEISRQTVYEPTPFPPEIWKTISIEARMFVDNLLQKDPKQRMGIKDVLQHNWLKKFNSKENMSFQKRNDSDLSGSQTFEVFSTLAKH